MMRLSTLLVLICLSFSVRSQDAIHVTDPIPQQKAIQKAIIVIPGITTAQLQSLKTEFAKYDDITQAVYVYQNHNCLLVSTTVGGAFKFYTDLTKIIQGATNITEQQMTIKTSDVYDKIMPSSLVTTTNPGDEINTNFIVK